MNAQLTASHAYKQSSILTATPERLVVMLYDGALRFLARASAAMREGEVPAAGEALRRALAIVDELDATLDMDQGEVAERLQGIYVFSRKTLLQAQIASDPAMVDRVAGLLRELREAWAEICGG